MNPEWSYRKLVLTNLILIFVLSAPILSAQNVWGIVLEEQTNKPLADVNVYIKETGIGTTTNEKGEFHLKNFTKIRENDTLNFSYVGYVSKALTYSQLKGNNFVVFLSESAQILEGVTVTTDKQLNLQIPFTRLASLKSGLYSFGSVLIGDKIWVISGDESTGNAGYKSITFSGANLKMRPSFKWLNYNGKLQTYDLQTDKWTTSDLKFSKRAYHNIHYYNDKIYVLGGKRLSTNRKLEYLDDKIEVYDIKQNTILVDKTNPHQTIDFASFVYKDNLIVMGGSTMININEEKEFTAKVHFLNLKTGYWYELSDMPVAMETKGVLVDSTIYLLGGFNLKPLDNIETYNIATGEWKTVGQLFYGVERPALACNDNIIYIFEEGRIQTFNIVTKELNLYSIDLPLKSCELFYSNNMLYILGGLIVEEYSPNEYYNSPSSDLYRIDLNEFKRAVSYSAKTL